MGGFGGKAMSWSQMIKSAQEQGRRINRELYSGILKNETDRQHNNTQDNVLETGMMNLLNRKCTESEKSKATLTLNNGHMSFTNVHWYV